MGTKRNLLSLHRRIARDAVKTVQANAPGGRYHTASTSEKVVAAAWDRRARRFTE